MTIGRIIDVLFGSPLYTLYIFLCTIILCFLFQVFVLKKEANKNNFKLSAKHFIWVYIFLLYLAFVFQETDIGTIWIIGRYDTLIRTSEISLIPFGTFDSTMLLSNILTLVLNIIMTMPFGFLLPLIWTEFRSIKKVTLTGFFFSLAIELSQLLNRRATTVDDLLMNTIGVIIGCIIFKALLRAVTKRNRFKPTTKTTSFIIRNEAIIYLVCAFVGVFLFYNSLYVIPVGTYNEGENQTSTAYMDTETLPTGTIAEISNDAIVVDRIILQEFDGKLSMNNSGARETIILSENTTIEIWQTDAEGTLEPIVSQVSRDTLSIHDLIEVQWENGKENTIAEKIIIWKFDL